MNEQYSLFDKLFITQQSDGKYLCNSTDIPYIELIALLHAEIGDMSLDDYITKIIFNMNWENCFINHIKNTGVVSTEVSFLRDDEVIDIVCHGHSLAICLYIIDEFINLLRDNKNGSDE